MSSLKPRQEEAEERLTHQEYHHPTKHSREYARLAHRIRNRNNKPNALKRENGRAHQQRIILRIKQCYIRDPLLCNDRKLLTCNVHESDEDERVCDERRPAELREVAHEGEREEDEGLREDEVLDGDERAAACDCENEGLEVGGDEDRVGCDEAELGDYDGGEDREAHPSSVQLAPRSIVYVREVSWSVELGVYGSE